MICVIHAHPYPRHSRACRALLEAIRPIPDLEVRSLYDLYPDFDIDIAVEQDALARAQLVVWLHPLYWYSVPGLMKHWFDKVLERGWAYGETGTALQGKHCLWVPSVGGPEDTYAQGRTNLLPFKHYVGPVEQTARYCGMEWEEPFVVFGALTITDDGLADYARRLRVRIGGWTDAHDWRSPVEAEGIAP
ncbi:MAG: glutathione-regulated potassium-efflux system oxidoreductase KefF [Betaproteobacteria bacterium]